MRGAATGGRLCPDSLLPWTTESMAGTAGPGRSFDSSTRPMQAAGGALLSGEGPAAGRQSAAPPAPSCSCTENFGDLEGVHSAGAPKPPPSRPSRDQWEEFGLRAGAAVAGESLELEGYAQVAQGRWLLTECTLPTRDLMCLLTTAFELLLALCGDTQMEVSVWQKFSSLEWSRGRRP